MSSFWEFLNSSFFIALVTLAAGLIAYWLYRKRNKDFKKDAANIVLLEIQNAERILRVAKEQIRKDIVDDNAYTMPTESWSKYKYMFVRDFDRDEWDSINNFYDKCHLYDDAVAHKSTAFKKNESEIRTNMHRVTADYIKKLIDDGGKQLDRQATVALIDAFQDEYLGLRQDLNLYQPNKPVFDAKAQLETISDNLSQTNVGTKLKKLAGLKHT
jgi:hypothetical protein